MAVLRKRKTPPPPAPARKKQQTTKTAPKATPKAAPKAKEAANGSADTSKPAPGDIITLDGFGGDVETHDGNQTTLKALVDESKSGVVLFTYPKASTPGCTTQACLFRDSYEPLTKGGLAIYGLSTDSPKANTNFKEKKTLPYTLLCDPKSTLIAAIGLTKEAKKTARGVFVVDKEGKVLIAETGGPQATLDAVAKLVEGSGEGTAEGAPEKPTEEAEPANGDVTAQEKKEETEAKDEKKDEEKTEEAA